MDNKPDSSLPDGNALCRCASARCVQPLAVRSEALHVEVTFGATPTIEPEEGVLHGGDLAVRGRGFGCGERGFGCGGRSACVVSSNGSVRFVRCERVPNWADTARATVDAGESWRRGSVLRLPDGARVGVRANAMAPNSPPPPLEQALESLIAAVGSDALDANESDVL